MGSTVVTALYQQPTVHEVVVTFLVDSVALEPDETFELELVPLPSIILPDGEGVFFVNKIQMTIIDGDRK